MQPTGRSYRVFSDEPVTLRRAPTAADPQFVRPGHTRVVGTYIAEKLVAVNDYLPQDPMGEWGSLQPVHLAFAGRETAAGDIVGNLYAAYLLPPELREDQDDPQPEASDSEPWRASLEPWDDVPSTGPLDPRQYGLVLLGQIHRLHHKRHYGEAIDDIRDVLAKVCAGETRSPVDDVLAMLSAT